MKIIRADTPHESMLKCLEVLRDTKKEEIQDLVIDIKDGRNIFAFCPPVQYHLAYELQELEDIIAGEQVMNGMRFRYARNPAQFKANGRVDWQYSHDSAPQIEAIKRLLEADKLDDKGIISFWNPARDTQEFTRRVDAGYDSYIRQRHPCGLVWQFRKKQRGFHINITNRSIWIIQSYSSDLHIPGIIGMYLGRPIESYTMFVYKLKYPRLSMKGGLETLCDVMHNCLKDLEETVKPYKATKDEFRKLQAGTAACRVGGFDKAYAIAEKMNKDGMYRDWLCTIAITERYLHRKWLYGNKEYGVKSALQTKALNVAKEFTSKKFWELMNPHGMLKHALAYWYIKPMLLQKDIKAVKGAFDSMAGGLGHVLNSASYMDGKEAFFAARLMKKWGV